MVLTSVILYPGSSDDYRISVEQANAVMPHLLAWIWVAAYTVARPSPLSEHGSNLPPSCVRPEKPPIPSHSSLLSSLLLLLIVPRCRLNTYDRPRAFPVAGPTVRNSLQPDELLKRSSVYGANSFKTFFKTILFSFY